MAMKRLIMCLAIIIFATSLISCGKKSDYTNVSGDWISFDPKGRFEITEKGEFIIKSGISPQTYKLTQTGPNEFEYLVKNSDKTIPVKLSGDMLLIGSIWKSVRYPWPAAGKYVWAEENETIVLNPDYTVSFGEKIKAKSSLRENIITLTFITSHPSELKDGMVLELHDSQIIWKQGDDELPFQ